MKHNSPPTVSGLQGQGQGHIVVHVDVIRERLTQNPEMSILNMPTGIDTEQKSQKRLTYADSRTDKRKNKPKSKCPLLFDPKSIK